jgi:hypothetical protein
VVQLRDLKLSTQREVAEGELSRTISDASKE